MNVQYAQQLYVGRAVKGLGYLQDKFHKYNQFDYFLFANAMFLGAGCSRACRFSCSSVVGVWCCGGGSCLFLGCLLPPAHLGSVVLPRLAFGFWGGDWGSTPSSIRVYILLLEEWEHRIMNHSHKSFVL
jgi:hypothetical protein